MLEKFENTLGKQKVFHTAHTLLLLEMEEHNFTKFFCLLVKLAFSE